VTTLVNYSVARGSTPLLISSIFAVSPQVVRILMVQAFQPGSHTVSITLVEDVAGNAIADTTVGFNVPVPPPPPGGPESPVLALHVQAALTGKAPDRCGAAPTSTCNQFWSEGQVATPYDLYVILVDQNNPGGSLAGTTFGVDYGGGLSISQWTNCGDLEFPGNGWPASGGGNLVTFDAIANCQQNVHGFELHATIGVFYVYAYSVESFSITPRLYVQNPDLRAADCSAAETDIHYPQGAGTAGFGIFGYNPCNGGATPIEPATWGNIKLQFSGEGDLKE